MSKHPLAGIPQERAAAVGDALARCFPKTTISGVSLMSGGLSGSSVFKIQLGGRAYVLKLNPTKEQDSGYFDAMTLAAEAGVAPRLYFNDLRQGISISDFIINKPIRGVYKPDELMRKLAGKIRTVHAIPFETKSRGLFDTVDGLIANFNDSGKLSGPVFEQCFRLYETLKSKYFFHDSDRVLSHNDLNPNNILCDGKETWFVDWDVASLNDRYIDLANTANYFVHTGAQERDFLRAYFEREITEQELARLFVMRQVCRVIYSLLMLELAIKGKPADFKHNQQMSDIDLSTFGAAMATGGVSLAAYEGRLMYGKALMNTAVAQMGSNRFEEALDQL